MGEAIVMMRPAWPGWELCETCGGTGVGHKVYDETGVEFIDCPDCASGFVPPGWQVEAAARAMHESVDAEVQQMGDDSPYPWDTVIEPLKEKSREHARTALVAAAKAEREERG